MDIFSHLNILAILTGTILYFLLGAVWYSPVMFSKLWAEHNNIVITEEAKKQLPVMMTISFILMLIITIGLAVISRSMGICTLAGGIKLGLLCGGCFSVGSSSISNLYLSKKLILYIIDGGYHLAGTVLASVVLALWH